MKITDVVTMTASVFENADFDPDIVTPGAAGFIATGVFALAVIILGVNLVRRLRRNAYRHQVREELAAEQAAGASADGDGVAPDAAPGRTEGPYDPNEPDSPSA